jgi:hypothetical protein
MGLHKQIECSACNPMDQLQLYFYENDLMHVNCILAGNVLKVAIHYIPHTAPVKIKICIKNFSLKTSFVKRCLCVTLGSPLVPQTPPSSLTATAISTG